MAPPMSSVPGTTIRCFWYNHPALPDHHDSGPGAHNLSGFQRKLLAQPGQFPPTVEPLDRVLLCA
eukprot:3640586-Rhodomonas_salina.2